MSTVSIASLSPPACANKRCSVGVGQRHVAVQDQRRHVVVKLRHGLHHRVAGAQLRFLQGKSEIVGIATSAAPFRRRDHI